MADKSNEPHPQNAGREVMGHPYDSAGYKNRFYTCKKCRQRFFGNTGICPCCGADNAY